MVQFVHTLVEDGEHGTFIENNLIVIKTTH